QRSTSSHVFTMIHADLPNFNYFPTRRSSDLFPVALAAQCDGALMDQSQEPQDVAAKVDVVNHLNVVRLGASIEQQAHELVAPSSDRKSTILNSSISQNWYAFFCWKKKNRYNM